VAMRWAQRLKRALRRKMAGAPRPVLVTQVWRGIHQHLAAAPWHSIVFAASGLVVASRERRDGRVHRGALRENLDRVPCNASIRWPDLLEAKDPRESGGQST
jgi:hypothetical protein